MNAEVTQRSMYQSVLSVVSRRSCLRKYVSVSKTWMQTPLAVANLSSLETRMSFVKLWIPLTQWFRKKLVSISAQRRMALGFVRAETTFHNRFLF